MSERRDLRGASPGDETWIYILEPGDEYAYTTEPDWFDDVDDPVTIVRQRWVLERTETVVFHPRIELCPRCAGDEVIDVPEQELTDVPCPTCAGDPGLHPLAGEMEVIDG